MNDHQMRIEFLTNEYVPYIREDLKSIRNLTPAGLIEKCEEYDVEVVAGTEALRNRLSNKMHQLKRNAHQEIADTIEAML